MSDDVSVDPDSFIDIITAASEFAASARALVKSGRGCDGNPCECNSVSQSNARSSSCFEGKNEQ